MVVKPRAKKCSREIHGEPCRRRGTHHVEYYEVQRLDPETLKPMWGPRGQPVKVAGVLRVVPGVEYCREHADAWASGLNRRDQERELAELEAEHAADGEAQ